MRISSFSVAPFSSHTFYSLLYLIDCLYIETMPVWCNYFSLSSIKSYIGQISCPRICLLSFEILGWNLNKVTMEQKWNSAVLHKRAQKRIQFSQNTCEEAVPQMFIKNKRICKRITGIYSNNLWPYYQNILVGPGRFLKIPSKHNH